MNIFSFIANAGGGMDLSSGGNAAFQGGYQIGYFVGIALAFLAPGFAVRSLFRRQVNKKCALSMVFLLAAFAIASLVGPFNEATSPALKVMTGALDMVAVLVSAILAIIGLVEFRESGARFGRKRAIVSLIICGFLLLAFIGGVQRGMRNRGFGGNPQAKPASFERTDLNFRIDYGPPWVSIKPLQAENQLMLTSGVPQMFFAMVAEQVGVESSVDTKAIMDIVKARDPNAVAHDECPMTINGVDGIRFQLDATVKGYVLFYDYWVAARDGYAYQLYGWTAPANKLALQREKADRPAPAGACRGCLQRKRLQFAHFWIQRKACWNSLEHLSRKRPGPEMPGGRILGLFQQVAVFGAPGAARKAGGGRRRSGRSVCRLLRTRSYSR